MLAPALVSWLPGPPQDSTEPALGYPGPGKPLPLGTSGAWEEGPWAGGRLCPGPWSQPPLGSNRPLLLWLQVPGTHLRSPWPVPRLCPPAPGFLPQKPKLPSATSSSDPSHILFPLTWTPWPGRVPRPMEASLGQVPGAPSPTGEGRWRVLTVDSCDPRSYPSSVLYPQGPHSWEPARATGHWRGLSDIRGWKAPGPTPPGVASRVGRPARPLRRPHGSARGFLPKAGGQRCPAGRADREPRCPAPCTSSPAGARARGTTAPETRSAPPRGLLGTVVLRGWGGDTRAAATGRG